MLLLLCGNMPANATIVTVKVTVTEEPCIINEGHPISVDFGDNVQVPNVDGHHYKRMINYSFICRDASRNGLKLTISGTGAGFDSTVLAADQSNLGIKFLNNGQSLSLNQSVNFFRDHPPTLEAVLVKNPSGTLHTGIFRASATMMVEYQ